MSTSRGFRDVGYNGSANGAGIVLPESGTLDDVIKNVKENGLINFAANKQQQAAAAQTNKDFATNKLNISPTTQYQGELNGLAQKWFDKGVQYRRQGFDPFNANWNNPTQAAAAQEYLNEKAHIEALAGLAKDVSTDYAAKSKAAEENKLEGFDDYNNKIKNTSLQDLYKQGGVDALPALHKPFDMNEVDKNIKLKPQEVEYNTPGPMGTDITTTHKFVNMPQAASAAEQVLNNTPGSLNYFNKKGIGDPSQLYTYKGGNMIRDPKNVEDFGHIDEPGIYHQMVTEALTDPEQIKELPTGVKQRIVANMPGMVKTVPSWVNGQPNITNAAADAMQSGYKPTEDPEFKQYIDKQYEDQIGKERNYQGEIMDAVGRQLPNVELGDKTKTDATMANLALRKTQVQQGWQRLSIEQQNSDRLKQQAHDKLNDTQSREKFITDIQNMEPGAIQQFGAAINEIPGASIVAHRGGITVKVPNNVPNQDFLKNKQLGVVINEKVLNPQYDGVNSEYIVQPHEYPINKFSGAAGRRAIQQILNKLPSMGKEKSLKTEPYNPDFNDIGTPKDNTPTSADDL